MSHHLHLDICDEGHRHVHCLRCSVNLIGQFPAEPCSNPDVAVICETQGQEAEVVINLHGKDA